MARRYAVLSGGDGWHVRDLARAAGERGAEVVSLDFRALGASLGLGGRLFDGFDAVVVRTMPAGSLEQVVFRMDLLHRAAACGVPVLNPPAALETCIDKYLTSARLEAAGLPVPPTVVCQGVEPAMAGFADLGGDVVVKPLFGSEGRGMVRVTDPDIAWRTFKALEAFRHVIYVQQFIHHPGWDLRVFVLAGRVVATMRRYARDGWRTNVAQGGRAEMTRLGPDEHRLALRAAEAVGVTVAGVDLLPGPAGERYVLEVNAVPGWRALTRATGVDVAAAVVDFLGGTA